MPELSRFYGLIVAIYSKESHATPHIHVYRGGKGRSAEYWAALRIEDGSKLDGNLSSKDLTLVRAWMIIHRTELMRAWNRAVLGQAPGKVKPLQ